MCCSSRARLDGRDLWDTARTMLPQSPGAEHDGVEFLLYQPKCRLREGGIFGLLGRMY
jgi:hypothetical protein